MAIYDNVRRIRDELSETCLRVGRDPDEISLMAVSKFHEAPLIEEAAAAGIRLFGESRVQEALRKFTTFRQTRPGMELHLIGGLQRNKARAAAGFFDCIETLDRLELVRELGRACGGRAASPLPVLFELNVGEESKSGFTDEDALCAGVEAALGFEGLLPCGLMTMAPFTGDEKPIRAAFGKLVKAQARLRRTFPDRAWDCLSMGMSGDFKIAIEEGSTLLRIGTAIFGDRR
ncbi:MAG: YggS family pyridoxal phosphate-dependent enzyme [Spirochaetaceae bacterium]|jgi:pyridoxal phosphate enzyme (YggS family)|nr:YggS family pyridoxal phosphate-dependent enzyme [Spirochaetaceae bacterium]